jgi:hypothetical protein
MPSHDEFETFARKKGLPIAFARLLVDAGFSLPNEDREENYSDWMVHHYDEVRHLAGLEPLPPLTGVIGKARDDLQVFNVLVTIMDFTTSRSTNPGIKEAWVKMKRELEAHLDGH